MKHLPPGLDGELMSDGKFGNVQSAIMSYQGTPDFTYHVFDHIPMWEDPRHHRMILTEYYDRMEMLKKVMRALILPVGLNVIMVNTFMAYNEDELLDFEQDCVMVGYEGICFRSPASPYKFGRSTWNEGWLVKMKRFEDDEATIVGTVELEHNDNDPEKDNLGYTVRTSHQSGMVAGNKLGAFTVVSKNWKESFKVGSGLCQTDREELWKVRESLIGKTIKFKYQPHGTKDRPRTPIFLSFRNSSDM
jgi:DNA ligase-1